MSIYVDTSRDQLVSRHPFTHLHVLYVRVNWGYLNHWRGRQDSVSKCVDWYYDNGLVMSCHKDVIHEYGLKREQGKEWYVDPYTGETYRFNPGGFTRHDPINQEDRDYKYPVLRESFEPLPLKRSTIRKPPVGDICYFWTMDGLDYGIVSETNDYTRTSIDILTEKSLEQNPRVFYPELARITKVYVMENVGNVTSGVVNGEWLRPALDQLFMAYGAIQDSDEMKGIQLSEIPEYAEDSIHPLVEFNHPDAKVNGQDVKFPIPRVNPRRWKFEANLCVDYAEEPDHCGLGMETVPRSMSKIYTMPNSRVRILEDERGVKGDLEGKKLTDRVEELFKNV